MKFRIIYWITEEVMADGTSHATGIYTSLHDLQVKGLRRLHGDSTSLRLSLVQLDAAKGPLGVWSCDNIDSMMQDLMPFVEGGELIDSDCKELIDAFRLAILQRT